MSNLVFPSAVRGLAFTVVKTIESSSSSQVSPTFGETRILNSSLTRWHWRLEYSILFDDILRPNPSYTYTDLQELIGFCQARYNNYDSFLFTDPDDNFVGPGVITAGWQANTQYQFGSIVIASGHAQQVVSVSGNGYSGLSVPTFSTSGGTVLDNNLIWSDLGAATNGGTNWPNLKAQLQIFSAGTPTVYYSPIQRYLGGQSWEDITDLNGSLTIYDNGILTTNYNLVSGGFSISGQAWSGLYLVWTSVPTGPITATFNYYFRVVFEEPSIEFEKFVNLLWAMGGEEGVQGKGYLKLRTSPNIIQAG